MELDAGTERAGEEVSGGGAEGDGCAVARIRDVHGGDVAAGADGVSEDGGHVALTAGDLEDAGVFGDAPALDEVDSVFGLGELFASADGGSGHMLDDLFGGGHGLLVGWRQAGTGNGQSRRRAM